MIRHWAESRQDIFLDY